uniref:Protein kinase domain-containing protein n=1 Tax=Anser brachyrhynchus TaxID=132585 RepID=A0A8B9IC47_9AVES
AGAASPCRTAAATEVPAPADPRRSVWDGDGAGHGDGGAGGDGDRGGHGIGTGRRPLVLVLQGCGSPPHRGWGSPSLRQPSPAVRLEDLVAVRYEEGQKQGQRVVLGTGGFGRVELVRCREQLFALKRIRKDWVVRTQQQEHVRTERRVLAQSHCPFVVGFFGTFRDRQHVYLLLEFCQGGELWTKLREVRYFEEPVAVFCSACVVEGLEYLHSHGIVYRDLKPENLMLDKQGYVKLVDFGFAKELERGEKTYSFCGTPEYLAPEMLRHEGHDFAVDFWMLGILIFEMLVGRAPFHSADPQKIYSRILDGIFSFPAFLSEAACSLIAKLCRSGGRGGGLGGQP